MQPDIIEQVSGYVEFLLRDKLSLKLAFHNIEHTINVVTGAREIGLNSSLSENELEIVELAAWLHDTGYLYLYKGHENESVRMASMFLASQKSAAEKTAAVIGCIEATRYPQQPKNLLEQVVCDADFYHFAMPDYPAIASKLRIEWMHYLGKGYSDREWNTENCQMLKAHTYFTAYGKKVLQPLKEQNLKTIQAYCNN